MSEAAGQSPGSAVELQWVPMCLIHEGKKKLQLKKRLIEWVSAKNEAMMSVSDSLFHLLCPEWPHSGRFSHYTSRWESWLLPMWPKRVQIRVRSRFSFYSWLGHFVRGRWLIWFFKRINGFVQSWHEIEEDLAWTDDKNLSWRGHGLFILQNWKKNQPRFPSNK